MLNLSEIKHHIKSVEETKQITSAMELISVSKMKKALKRYDSNLTYFNKVRFTIKNILQNSEDIRHKFFVHRNGKRTVYIVIASDKGLAGGYNQNVLNLAWKHMETVDENYVFTVGQMAREFFATKGQNVDMEFTHTIQDPTLDDARRITDTIVDMYNQNLFDEVLVVFTRFYSTAHQEPQIIKLLPVEERDFKDVAQSHDMTQISYEPTMKNVFDLLVPQYILGLLYACLVQSVASEHHQRMIAMQSATKNADEMISRLKTDFNRARQERITQEIAEIIGGSYR